MGNLCGKESKSNFAGEGRTLGSAPPPKQRTRVSIPAANKPTPSASGPGRTVGGAAASGSAGDDPKAAAARAAEERAQKAQGTGKLGKQLDSQKKQTRTATLEQAAEENRLAREADAATKARHYN